MGFFCFWAAYVTNLNLYDLNLYDEIRLGSIITPIAKKH